MTEPQLPIHTPDAIDGDRSDRHVHGVVLAAGTSNRFGPENKLLAAVEGDPLVRHAARTLLASAVDGVTVVVGCEANRVRNAIDGLSVSVRENPDYDRGKSTTVREGIQAATERGADAAVIALGDMPHVSVGSVDALVAAYERGAGTAIALAHGDQRGNPVLFDARHFEALADVTGDVGGREILLSTGAGVLLSVDDPGVVHDIDRPEDL